MVLNDEVKKSIKDSVLCWLATSSKDNIPNVSPKEVFTYYGDTKIIIANIASPGSVSNILNNPLVCVSFIDVFRQKGYQVKGNATIITTKDTEFHILNSFLEPIATRRFPIASIISIEVSKIKPILAPSYILYPKTSEKEQITSALNRYNVEELLKDE